MVRQRLQGNQARQHPSGAKEAVPETITDAVRRVRKRKHRDDLQDGRWDGQAVGSE